MTYMQIADYESEIETEPYGAVVEVVTRREDVVLRYELTPDEAETLANNLIESAREVRESG